MGHCLSTSKPASSVSPPVARALIDQLERCVPEDDLSYEAIFRPIPEPLRGYMVTLTGYIRSNPPPRNGSLAHLAAIRALKLGTGVPILADILVNISPTIEAQYGPRVLRTQLLDPKTIDAQGWLREPERCPFWPDRQRLIQHSHRIVEALKILIERPSESYHIEWVDSEGRSHVDERTTLQKWVFVASETFYLWLLAAAIQTHPWPAASQPQWAVLHSDAPRIELMRSFSHLPVRPYDEHPPSVALDCLLAPSVIAATELRLGIPINVCILDVDPSAARIVELLGNLCRRKQRRSTHVYYLLSEPEREILQDQRQQIRDALAQMVLNAATPSAADTPPLADRRPVRFPGRQC